MRLSGSRKLKYHALFFLKFLCRIAQSFELGPRCLFRIFFLFQFSPTALLLPSLSQIFPEDLRFLCPVQRTFFPKFHLYAQGVLPCAEVLFRGSFLPLWPLLQFYQRAPWPRPMSFGRFLSHPVIFAWL